MPRIEEDAYATLIRQLPKLVKELHIANQLKALELKAKTLNDWSAISPEMIDYIVED